jgi:glutathione synthase/RimK-type ligase-like ATP-grasp enzyme
MKTLHLIYQHDTNTSTVELLTNSAIQRGIAVHPIITEYFDFTQPIELTVDDGLYRISSDPQSILIEKFLINYKVASFYATYKDCISNVENVVEATLIHQKVGLPVIPSISSLTQDKNRLLEYANFLGGFPLVIKAAGGHHGVGVMKIDSLDSLTSVTDYIVNQRNDVMLRQYIDYKTHARLIVLGDKVIDSVEYERGDNNDFRNSELMVQPKIFSPELEQIAIQAVTVLGFTFGGVDILIDRHDKPYLAEVNFPCYFTRTQEITGKDIAGQMIDYLAELRKYDPLAK